MEKRTHSKELRKVSGGFPTIVVDAALHQASLEIERYNSNLWKESVAVTKDIGGKTVYVYQQGPVLNVVNTETEADAA